MTTRRHFEKKSLGLVLALVIVMSLTALMPLKARAATFEDINDSSVFFKQNTSVRCVLAANAMMLRRYAMARGDSNWSAITQDSIASVATTDGASVWYSYSVSNTGTSISVSHAYLPGGSANTQKLIDLLGDHVEGIVIYYTGQPHAVLLTDYTNGTFYCADPANGTAAGRIPLSSAFTVSATNVTEYWYVSSPKVSLDPIITYHNPEGSIEVAEGGNGTIRVKGWAFDRDEPDKCVPIDIYVGGPSGSGAERLSVLTAYNYIREDINQRYGINGRHGFDSTIYVSATGNKKLYIYAIDLGGGNDVLIGTKEVCIFPEHECDMGRYLYPQEEHPHRKCYECSVCGKVWVDNTSRTILDSCAECHRPARSWFVAIQKDCYDYEPITFTWNRSENATNYDLMIYKQNESGRWELYKKLEDVKHAEPYPSVTLPAGMYRAVIRAYNRDFWDSENDCWLYTDSIAHEFEVVHPLRSLATCTITLSQNSFVYDGKPKTPSVTVVFKGKTLVYGTDYGYRFVNNTNAGTAKVIVSGQGDYWGSAEKTFTIKARAEKTLPFTDVTKSKTYYDAVYWAYFAGIVKGKSETRFAPGDSLTRGEFCTMLWRMFGKPAVSDKDVSSMPFADAKKSNHKKAIAWCYKNGVISGYKVNGKQVFKPSNTITRGNIIVMLFKLAKQEKNYKPATIKNPYTDVKSTNKNISAYKWAYQNGVVTTKKLGPSTACKRWEMVSYLYGYNNTYKVVK